MSKSMKTRIITGIVSVIVFIPFLIFSGTWAYIVAMILLSGLAVFEMLGCLGFRRNFIVSLVSYLYVLSAIILTRIIDRRHFLMYIAFSSLVFLIFLMSISLFSHGKVQVDHISEVFMMMFYIGITFSCMVLTRDVENGAFVFLIVYLTAWTSDICAYFSGVAFGKHKLIPDVSPKKTVEGAVGGLASTVLTMLIYAAVLNIATDLRPNYLVFIIGAVILSLSSMVGDLFASLMKRKHGIKDYGFIMPGHGGILDRFDSVLATSPLVLLISITAGFFG